MNMTCKRIIVVLTWMINGSGIIWNGSTDTNWLKKAKLLRSKLQLSQVIKSKREERLKEESKKLKLMKESAVEKNFQSVHTGIVGLKSGTHGLWQGPLEETVVGVLPDPTRFQRFKEKHYGHVPFSVPECRCC